MQPPTGRAPPLHLPTCVQGACRMHVFRAATFLHRTGSHASTPQPQLVAPFSRFGLLFLPFMLPGEGLHSRVRATLSCARRRAAQGHKRTDTRRPAGALRPHAHRQLQWPALSPARHACTYGPVQTGQSTGRLHHQAFEPHRTRKVAGWRPCSCGGAGHRFAAHFCHTHSLGFWLSPLVSSIAQPAPL
jgi:hypothetical protein